MILFCPDLTGKEEVKVLVVSDGIVFGARERDLLRCVKFRDGIIQNHIPQHRAELIQRIVADQIRLAVADGNIPLLKKLR